MVQLLSSLKSMHHLIFPFFFLMGTKFDAHGEYDGSMTPCFIQDSSCNLRLSSRAGLIGLGFCLMGLDSLVIILCSIKSDNPYDPSKLNKSKCFSSRCCALLSKPWSCSRVEAVHGDLPIDEALAAEREAKRRLKATGYL